MSKPWVHCAIVTTVAAVSLACFGNTPEHVDVFEPGAPQPVVVQPVPDVAPTPDEQPSPDIVPVAVEDDMNFIGRLPPIAYTNSWLVIVASTPTPEPIPAAVLAAEEQSVGMLAADRLDSSQFKGLMPCWSIVIAGAAEERSVAAEMLEILTSNGVEGYIKHSGEYIGDDPRVQAVCEDMRSEGANQCPADGRMAQAIEGRWYVQMSVPTEVSERAMAGAPAPRAVDEFQTVWVSPLPLETAGDVGIGDTLHIDELSGAQFSKECTVSSFAAVTQGIAHFSYEGDTPGCGSPELWAVLDCGDTQAVGNAIATQSVDAAKSWVPLGEAGPATTEETRSAVTVALQNTAFRSAKAAAQATADEQGEALNEETTVRQYSAPGGLGVAVTTRWWTRDGEAYCGGDDVLVSRTAGVVGGRVATQVVDTTYASFVGVVSFQDEPTAHIVTHPMFGGTTLGHEDTECGITVAFCSCGC